MAFTSRPSERTAAFRFAEAERPIVGGALQIILFDQPHRQLLPAPDVRWRCIERPAMVGCGGTELRHMLLNFPCRNETAFRLFLHEGNSPLLCFELDLRKGSGATSRTTFFAAAQHSSLFQYVVSALRFPSPLHFPIPGHPIRLCNPRKTGVFFGSSARAIPRHAIEAQARVGPHF